MAVVGPVLKAWVRVAKKAFGISQRYDIYERFIHTRFPPHIRPYTRKVWQAAGVALSGGLILDAFDIANLVLPRKPSRIRTPSSPFSKTRNNMVQPFSRRRFKSSYCYPRTRSRRW